MGGSGSGSIGGGLGSNPLEANFRDIIFFSFSFLLSFLPVWCV